MNGDEPESLHVHITSRTHAAKHPRRGGPRQRVLLCFLAVVAAITLASFLAVVIDERLDW